jgi:hypothetical protein
MGLFNFLFGGDSDDSDDRSDSATYSSGSRELYDVCIRGMIQANGPVRVNRTIRMDRDQMRYFTGSKRYEAIEGWLRTHYPGAKIPSIRGFVTTSKRV